MKKIFTLLTLLFIVLAVTIMASPPVPKPVKIVVNINDDSVNEIVEILNTRTSELIKKNMYGGVIGFSMDEFKQVYYSSIYSSRTGVLVEAGDTVRFSVCSDLALCTKNIVIDDNNFPLYVNFKITDADYKAKYFCWNGDLVLSLGNCPIQPINEVPVEKEVVKEVVKEVIKEVPVDKVVEVPKEIIVTKEVDIIPLYAQVALGALIVLLIGLGYLYASNKSKYKWVPGMSAILKKNAKDYEDLVKAGKTAEAEKKLKTLGKTTKTMVEKYLK